MAASPSGRQRPCTLGRPSGAERSEGVGATKEVLGFIIDFDFNLDFLGFPLLLLGFPRIS